MASSATSTSTYDPKDPAKIAAMAANRELASTANQLLVKSFEYNYSYNFTWLGRPIIQYPQDIVAMQEILWRVQPDLIVETGIAHGGSLIFHASILEMIGGEGRVVGIDIDIRDHNRVEIERHPLFRRITLLEGSSTEQRLVDEVYAIAKNCRRVVVALDSNHTHEHVLRELELYSPLVKQGSYLVVFDTMVDDMPEDCFSDRPWGAGNNPKTAVHEFLKTTDRFVIDEEYNTKLLLTVAPDGYLRCVKD